MREHERVSTWEDSHLLVSSPQSCDGLSWAVAEPVAAAPGWAAGTQVPEPFLLPLRMWVSRKLKQNPTRNPRVPMCNVDIVVSMSNVCPTNSFLKKIYVKGRVTEKRRERAGERELSFVFGFAPHLPIAVRAEPG